MGDTAVLDEWPLLGRDAELDVLTGCLDGRGAVVAGAAGVGKTRLARAAEAVARTAGRPVERVVATRSSRALPLAPFARLRSPDDDAGDPLVALRRAIVGDHPTGTPVVSVDDAHLLDDASAALVHELCASGAATVLVTVRSREPAPDAVVALWKDELCERIELQPLSRQEAAALLAAALGAAVDATTAFALWRLSRGNVLHLRELVRGGLASGALAVRAGLWAWSGEPHAPPRLVELLADRLATLAAEQRRAVELLALGEPLAWSHLVALLEPGEAESLVTAGLAEIDAAASDAPASDGTAGAQGDSGELVVRLAHPLLGDVLEGEMPVPTRRRLLRELAAAPPAGERPARVALWHLDAGLPVPADLLVQAAEECLYADAHLGERFARAAVTAGAGGDAQIVLAQHLMFSHRAAEADETLAAIDERELTLHRRVQLTVNRANNLTWALARPDDAVALLDQAAASASAGVSTSDQAAVARELQAHSVPMLVFAGRVGEAVDRAEAIVADAASSPVERLRAGLGAVPALVAAGRPERALAWAAEALPLVGECGRELPIALGQLGAGASLAQLLSGDLDGADGLVRLGYEQGVAQNVPLMRGGAALRLGQVALWRGRPRSAAALVREAVLAMQETDAGFLAWAADTLRIACALVGDTEGLAAADATARTALRYPLYRTEVLRADAAVAAAAGSLSDARAAAAEGIELAFAGGQLIQAVVLLFDRARYGDAGAAAARLDEVAEVEGALAGLMRRTVAALATADADAADELEEASRGFEHHGYDLFAAEAARAAARVHADRGLVARERRADARADGIAARCEGARTPLLAGRPAATALTRREREVAELAAQDLTDAEIALRLALSIRTVETHLHRAYTKLGVPGRQALARFLG